MAVGAGVDSVCLHLAAGTGGSRKNPKPACPGGLSREKYSKMRQTPTRPRGVSPLSLTRFSFTSLYNDEDRTKGSDRRREFPVWPLLCWYLVSIHQQSNDMELRSTRLRCISNLSLSLPIPTTLYCRREIQVLRPPIATTRINENHDGLKISRDLFGSASNRKDT